MGTSKNVHLSPKKDILPGQEAESFSDLLLGAFHSLGSLALFKV